MRWLFGAGQPITGPEYCRTACDRNADDPTTQCEGCNEPRLLPEAAEAPGLFCLAWSQRVLSPAGRFLGFNYTGVRDKAAMRGLEILPEQAELLGAMEDAVSEIAREQAEEEADGDKTRPTGH